MLGHKNKSKKQGEDASTVSQVHSKSLWVDQMVEVILTDTNETSPREERFADHAIFAENGLL
jgi:hypothetical protein